MHRIIAAAALAAAAAGVLTACGDDYGYGYNGYGGPPPGLTSYIGTTDAFVAWADGYSGNFDFAPIGSYAGKRQMLRGTVDPVTGIDLGQQAGVEIAKFSDGHVYALDLTSYGTPVLTQVSSESGATVDDPCSLTGSAVAGANSDYLGVYFVSDLHNPTNSSYFYRLPGPDGICDTADDIVHLVTTGTPASNAPITVPAMPTTAVHDSIGAISGFVAKSGANLVLYDASFANPVVLGTFPAPIGVATVLPVGTTQGYPTGQLYVVDGNIVYVNYATPGVSGTLFTIPNWTPTDTGALFAASPSTLYFAVNTPASGSTPASSVIYALPADGSAAPTAVVTQAGVVTQMQYPAQSSNLIYSTVNGASYTLSALASGGTTPVTLVSSAQNGGSFTATAAAVYYTTWSEVTNATALTVTRSGTQSGIVGIGGNVIQAPLANSSFLSGGEYVPWPLVSASAITPGSVVTQTALETVFQVQGLTPVKLLNPANGYTYTIDGVSGGTILAIDTASNHVVAKVGTLPASTAMFLEASFRASDHTGFIEASNILSTQDPATRDIYLINSYLPGSLEPVTNNL